MINDLAHLDRGRFFAKEPCHEIIDQDHRNLSKRRRLFPAAFLLLTFLPAPATASDQPWVAHGKNGMVATESEHASQAGLAMLEAGGNAFDAAVAVSFALGVTRPYHTGLGGGGFLIARLADGKVIVQDFRETAPAAATRDMFVTTEGTEPPKLRPSEYGYKAVAVPGLVAGRCQILKQYGKLDLAKVLEPAVRLADEGFPVDGPYVEATADVLPVYEANPELKESCAYVWRTHLRKGELRKAGDTLKQPELAKLMRRIAKRGAEFFYEGDFADDFVAQVKANGGIISRRDLAEYKPKSREPLITSYHEYKLILMPPPSSGGIAIAEALNILETLDFVLLVKSDPIKALNYHIEAMRAAFADRAQFLGDTDFVEVPLDYLTSKSTASLYAKQIAERTAGGQPAQPKDAVAPSKDAPAPSKDAPAPPKDDGGTSHFCIADKFGNVVVSTETINTTFGSLAAIDEWGLILNNEMDDFTAEPGKPNAFGLVQSENNAITPGKRPLSSMSPTIVLKDDKPYLLVGGAGGPRIISGVLNVILGVIDYRRPLPEAITSPRPHHQWQPDEVAFDHPFDDEVMFDGRPLKTIADELAKLGLNVSDRRKTSTLQAIIKTDEGWLGVSDPSGGGKPRGMN